MTPLVPIALFGLIPLVFVLFAVLPPRRAMLTSYLFAWLFLPMAGYKVEGLPDYTKTSATAVCVLIAGVLFGGQLVTRFRPRWIDIPMAVYCLVPLISSLTNGLGPYDGFSAVLGQTVMWGLPYLSGRIFLSEPIAPNETATAILIGGLLYTPLCLFEIKMSPQLHILVYGFHQHSFLQTVRLGGWRPTVFMQHGLMVAVWMMSASLAGIWLWKTRCVRRLWGMQIMWLVAPLVVTTILCKSIGALVLLSAGLGALFAAKLFRMRVVIWVLMLFPLFYIPSRALNLWSGQLLPALMAPTGDVASGSLQFRLDNETILAAQAMKRPIFGWAGWGRSEATDANGRSISVPDGLWIIALGQNGFVGVFSLYASMLLPAFMFVRYVKARDWALPQNAGAAVLACLLVLYMIDCLFNAMVNPVFIAAAGCMASRVVAARKQTQAPSRKTRVLRRQAAVAR